jgi:hypothetical protein
MKGGGNGEEMPFGNFSGALLGLQQLKSSMQSAIPTMDQAKASIQGIGT